MAFLNILPDPNNPIKDSGTAGTGTAGPGFASVKLTSEQPTMKTRTNSGRLIARAISYHKWNINISYNPMTRSEFEPIYTFLLHRRGGLNPFFVSLPQYRTPRNASFATYVAGGSNTIDVDETSLSAGATSFTVDGNNYTAASNGQALPGDLFTISDSSDSNHKKAYMITRVETASDNDGTSPGTNKMELHFTPPLAKAVTNNADIIFNNPLIKVVMTNDIQEYSLGTNNLYQFGLQLEEVQ